ncbi:aminotransferase class I/II-fold pyridoxal phosphate-dependent enzyme [Ruegeria atlantica]|uniref:L-glutamine:2-deoxy-scyllo-inosose aminotransferase n=1 Tax=Ruegeria atlantica TaxID=81569 RepID=A0A0N7LR49_9RHOB|nr:aminotransferase class I/II-fold pyridoxal phosphate-dependent enzyme [Ruegeria atlantica]CUH49828.1 L-glutamine:2-deoxy-scyllo-inosose aminotransferase [Ruegeria atlantica]
MIANSKTEVDELAIFCGPKLFEEPKSTSSLVQPDFDRFLEYSKRFFDAAQYTNNGPNVQLLEERLAAFHGTSYCVTFCSGFWALVLTIKALVQNGKSEIVMPSLTYRRMADIAAWARLKPRFCEVDGDTLALSPAALEACLNDESAIIMAVHPIVNCCDVAGICAVANERGLPLLFDGVESAFETVPKGKIGAFGDAECFSMHASKLLNGFEGGYVTTNNEVLANRIKATRNFGFTGQDNVSVAGGMNAKLCELHATMALANLDQIDTTVQENCDRYRTYQRLMPTVPGLRLLAFDETQKTSFKNIVMEVEPDWPTTRDELVSILNAERILARAYYAPPLHRKSMLYPHVPADLPLTDKLAARFISMPCGDFVTQSDIQRILELLRFISLQGTNIREKLRTARAHNNAS